MAHFKLVSSPDMSSVDFSTPTPFATFRCSRTVADHIERRKPAGRRFTATPARDSFWLRKFEAHADVYPSAVKFARNSKGMWYAQAVFC